MLVGTLAREPIPGALRYAWMRELCAPDVDVVHVTDENPQEPHEHPDFWRIWTDTIRRAWRGPGPEVVFSSEGYGDELARRLGARHVAVDPGRAHVPISGTKVRADPLGNWEFLPPCVRAHFARRVAIVGPESTGKTTLAARLAEHYGTVWVPEYARGLLDRKPGGPTFVPADVPLIARGQLAAEDALARQANRVLFCDSDLITTRIYAEHYLGACPDWVARLGDERRYDLYLLTAADVPWVADPQRWAPDRRDEWEATFEQALASRGRPFAWIRGSWEQRFEAARAAVDALLAT